MWKQAFTFFDAGRGAALAIILLVAVTPVIWYNLRQFRTRAF
jgi:alpha-glucoside transport system permease protein